MISYWLRQTATAAVSTLIVISVSKKVCTGVCNHKNRPIVMPQVITSVFLKKLKLKITS